ncbi:MAG TPA: phosphate ABC transporter permease PstA [Micromonosporaceae bacterium]
MTTVTGTVVPRRDLRPRRLPSWSPALVAALAATVAVLAVRLGGLLGGGWALTTVVAVALFLTGLGTASRLVEGARSARDRVATALVYSAFTLALLPLVSVAATLVARGVSRLDGTFFSHSMRNITAFDSAGGAYHAIVGTVEQVGIAVMITVPLGVAAAVYVVEYGRGGLARAIQFVVDVMTGVPSIVAGLFVLAFWVLVVTPVINDGRPGYSGFAAALALSVLMLPTVTRSTEEMLRLVPATLREGAYALGIAKWKTVARVVLPAARGGIVTGVMLAIARAAGETAPVLLVAGGNPAINFNPFRDSQASLSLFIYDQAGLASKYGPPRAWTAALTLVALVLALTVAAKLLSRRTRLPR